ncbi:MAG: hypothetical protein GTN77_09335 [Planctomycetales bacterium]|nr:hypothetical protein [Planctomycetales bacterium]NIP86286.1 hypothetical protein [Planctomycetales bacterium]
MVESSVVASSPPADEQPYRPWLVIFYALRPAIGLRNLALAALGLIGTIAGWRVCWNVLVPPAGEGNVPPGLLARLAAEDGTAWPPWPWQPDFPRLGSQGLGRLWADTWLEPVLNPIAQLTLPFQFLWDRDLSYVGLAYAIACGLWTLAVWSFFGGAITRTAVLRLSRDEVAGWRSVRSFVQSKWSSYFAAPLFPLLGIGLLAIPVAVLGIFARGDASALVTAIFWPLALVAGFLMALLLVGLAFGWPLMWSTISAEGTDAFDALSRSYAYVFQRPLFYLAYAALAAGVGVVGGYLVHYFALLVVHVTLWGASWGGSADRVAQLAQHGLDSNLGGFASLLVMFCNSAVLTLAAGFAISYLWCAAAAIYLLLRRQVDAAELDDVYLEPQEERFGLPPLDEVSEDVADDTPAELSDSPTEEDT